MSNLLTSIIQLIRQRKHLWKRYYAQEGEDIILSRLMDKEKGFFIDIGAHHPFRFSNTYLFYKKGWRGINIDPLPGSKRLFNLVRRRDINIQCGVAKESGMLTYYCFNEPALNTFDKEEAKFKNDLPDYFIQETIDIPVEPLWKILDGLSLPPRIDFMSVDVEGMEMDVLMSNNWDRYRPEFLVVEQLRLDVQGIMKTDVYRFLQSADYKLVSRTLNSSIYQSVR
ncbi:MAG: FkbM family methyltransferase [Saprospiraceae bacterium]|nr:FkbM family methyltransferase [Saprospiraceae bacterium]MDP4998654.1 FkbM family methyltransferase [Saprospiraceae bacterium]